MFYFAQQQVAVRQQALEFVLESALQSALFLHLHHCQLGMHPLSYAFSVQSIEIVIFQVFTTFCCSFFPCLSAMLMNVTT